MRKTLARFLATTIFLLASTAAAERVTCEQVVAALSFDSDPDQVAESLGTTRARINACLKLDAGQQRHARQREQLHQDRAARGLD